MKSIVGGGFLDPAYAAVRHKRAWRSEICALQHLAEEMWNPATACMSRRQRQLDRQTGPLSEQSDLLRAVVTVDRAGLVADCEMCPQGLLHLITDLHT